MLLGVTYSTMDNSRSEMEAEGGDEISFVGGKEDFVASFDAFYYLLLIENTVVVLSNRGSRLFVWYIVECKQMSSLSTYLLLASKRNS